MLRTPPLEGGRCAIKRGSRQAKQVMLKPADMIRFFDTTMDYAR